MACKKSIEVKLSKEAVSQEVALSKSCGKAQRDLTAKKADFG